MALSTAVASNLTGRLVEGRKGLQPLLHSSSFLGWEPRGDPTRDMVLDRPTWMHDVPFPATAPTTEQGEALASTQI